MLDANVHLSTPVFIVFRAFLTKFVLAPAAFLAFFRFWRGGKGAGANWGYSLGLDLRQYVCDGLRWQNGGRGRRQGQRCNRNHDFSPKSINSNNMFTMFRTLLHAHNEGSVKQSMVILKTDDKKFELFKGLVACGGVS